MAKDYLWAVWDEERNRAFNPPECSPFIRNSKQEAEYWRKLYTEGSTKEWRDNKEYHLKVVKVVVIRVK